MSFSVYRKIANLILLLVASNLSAQVTYYDAAEFQLLGKATAATTERYVLCRAVDGRADFLLHF